jgi:Helix-turn-helix domain
MPKNFKLLTIGDAAERLGRTHSWVRKQIYAGMLKTVGGSKRLVVTEAELERFCSNTVTYTPRYNPNLNRKKAAAK